MLQKQEQSIIHTAMLVLENKLESEEKKWHII